MQQLLTFVKAALTGQWPGQLPQSVDWTALRQLATQQTVAGLVFDAINAHHSQLKLPQAEAIRWISLSQTIARRNQQLNDLLAKTVRTLDAAGIPPILLKGQGLAQFYPNPLARTPGDIDIYVGPTTILVP